MQSDFAVETTELTKVYRSWWSRREIRAVDGVTLAVARGTTFGFLGPNGAGKTTFVKVLLSAVHPTRGSARLFGLDARRPEARRPVGYLPENHRFPTYFTGAGMLDFYAALSGVDARTRRTRIPELLALVELDQWADVRLRKYSKGMLQRLGLAQALIHSPSLLILDEPSDGVDPIGRRHIRDILHSLEQRGVTIFINSHLLVEVEMFCREVAILKRGKVALTGKVQELTAGKGYRVRAVSPPEALVSELGGAAAASDGFFDFHFADREEANGGIDKLRGAGCEIESVAQVTSTLEDIFVRTVDDAA